MSKPHPRRHLRLVCDNDATADPRRAPKRPQQATVDRRRPVAHWIISLSEPLLSTAQRKSADDGLTEFIGRNVNWTCWWFAGFLHDIAHTLPPDDPWRHLSATIEFGATSASEHPETFTHTTPGGAAAPTSTGAIFADESPFGQISDSDDLIAPGLGSPDTDLALAGLIEGLDDLSAAVVAVASANVEVLARTLMTIHRHLWLAEFTGATDDRPSEAFLRTISAALRRLIHRRRIYTGPADEFPSLAGFAWMARADRLVRGKEPQPNEVDLVSEGAIDPTAYRDLRL